jgi:hypothetical protein
VSGSPGTSVVWKGLALGDLNNDGKPDVLAIENAAFDVALNQGGGAFAVGQRYAFTSGTAFATICDVNHDGKQDAVITSTNTVLIFPGKGDGTFGISYVDANLQLNGTFYPSCVDLNGDGNVDLVLSAYSAASGLMVALGNGDYSFKTPVAYGSSAAATSPVVVDVNGDGKLDVVWVTSANFVVYLGDGAGAFPTMLTDSVLVPELVPINGYRHNVAVGDIDGDGHVDVIFGADTGAVGVLLGAGDGTFPVQLAYPSGGPGTASNVLLADFNGDGRLDVVAGNDGGGGGSSQVLNVLLNDTVNACY